MTITRNHLNSILMVRLCQEDVYNFLKKMCPWEKFLSDLTSKKCNISPEQGICP